jgi:uncharacterized protein
LQRDERAVQPGPVARAALALIRAYKYIISPSLGDACRFVPSCSDYMSEALTRHGLLRGGWLGLRRLSRCHPLGGHGYDPPPLTFEWWRAPGNSTRPAEKAGSVQY